MLDFIHRYTRRKESVKNGVARYNFTNNFKSRFPNCGLYFFGEIYFRPIKGTQRGDGNYDGRAKQEYTSNSCHVRKN